MQNTKEDLLPIMDEMFGIALVHRLFLVNLIHVCINKLI